MTEVRGPADWRGDLIRLPRYTKRAILVALDFALLTTILWAIISLRYNELYLPEEFGAAALFLLAPLLTIASLGWFGLYRFVTRYIGYHGNIRIVGCVLLATMAWACVVFLAGQYGLPRSAIPAYGALAALALVVSRQLAGWLLSASGVAPRRGEQGAVKPKPVLIVGAQQAGAQLLRALRNDLQREVVAFVDPNPTLWGQFVSGIKVHRPARMGRVIERQGVTEVLLAMPEASRRERQGLIKELEPFNIEVKILPSIEQIASGKVRATDLRPVDVVDLLGRDPVPPDETLLSRGIRDRSIMITGAGGSVGSEIVRQIVKRSPRRVVLFDISEAALYQIDAEVRAKLTISEVDPEIVPVLGSILDAGLVRDTMRRYEIETVYHAAAYKHVPIIESNFVVGLTNNVFGTLTLAECAKAEDVKRFVLISTDKAVRPHNIMGASKRLSELILQSIALNAEKTVFTSVRFGNVLDSSGSVVPIFRKQIEAGGPVTVTHPDIVRYFMSIPEAAELVLQAGSMATGGEVFVLDMGEPVKIDALARLMIRLTGLEVSSSDGSDGDIQILYTGLRPGEKLYEELLIGVRSSGTEHPRITRAEEPCLPPGELRRRLDALRDAIATRDRASICEELLRTVDGYTVAASPREANRTSDTAFAEGSHTVH